MTKHSVQVYEKDIQKKKEKKKRRKDKMKEKSIVESRSSCRKVGDPLMPTTTTTATSAPSPQGSRQEQESSPAKTKSTVLHLVTTSTKRKRPTKSSTSQDADTDDNCKDDENSSSGKKQGRKKNKKKKKRLVVEVATTTEAPDPSQTNPDDHPVGKRSKKKKKKRQGGTTNTTTPSDPSSTKSNNEEDYDTATLEGCMMAGEMVLIDRKNSKVYSAMERLENGAHQQVGTLDNNGELTLWKNDKTTMMVKSNEAENHVPGVDSNGSKLSKLQQQQQKEATAVVNVETNDVASFPFATDPDDHCESPLEAYRDIVPLLQQLACLKKDAPSSFRIYDPYYCNGAVVQNLTALGFPNVYNRKEDCYHVWDSAGSSYPDFDVLVTNPPYSLDHMEKLIDHITMSPKFGQRPWCLLLPQFVHKKDYFEQRTQQANIRPFFLVPRKRYVYLPPPSFRASKKSDVHKKSSPFVSMWYVWGGTPAMTERLFAGAQSTINNCDVARSKSALRDLRRKGKK